MDSKPCDFSCPQQTPKCEVCGLANPENPCQVCGLPANFVRKFTATTPIPEGARTPSIFNVHKILAHSEEVSEKTWAQLKPEFQEIVLHEFKEKQDVCARRRAIRISIATSAILCIGMCIGFKVALSYLTFPILSWQTLAIASGIGMVISFPVMAWYEHRVMRQPGMRDDHEYLDQFHWISPAVRKRVPYPRKLHPDYLFPRILRKVLGLFH